MAPFVERWIIIMAKMIFASRYIYNTLPEYEGCRQCFTIGSASEFNTQALERNLDMSAVKENYVDCLANRLRKEWIGEHGLLTDWRGFPRSGEEFIRIFNTETCITPESGRKRYCDGLRYLQEWVHKSYFHIISAFRRGAVLR